MTNAAIATIDEDPFAKWIADRKKVITGTDLGILFGVSRYKKTPMDVWLDKTGRGSETEDNDALYFGRLFEGPILTAYAKKKGVELAFPGSMQLLTVPEYPHLGATLDAIVKTGEYQGMPVDAKNMGFRTNDFGDDGSDVMPLAYALQLTLQMMVAHAERAELAVLFNRYEFNTFYCVRDPLVVERIAEVSETFMLKNVRADTPPAVDGSEGWSNWLNTHLRQKTKDMRRASAIDNEQAVKLHAHVNLIKALETEAEAIRNRFKEIIGDAYGMEPEDQSWKITWAQAKDKLKVDWEAIAKKYQDTLLDLNAKILDAAMPEDERTVMLNHIAGILAATITDHSAVTPGSRAFRFTKKGE